MADRAGGDTVWSDVLVAEYATGFDRLVRLATMMLGVRAEAEEIVQDAFVATARAGSRVIDPGPYARRAVVNGCIGVLRKRRRARLLPVDEPPPGSPDQLVELRDALLALPARQRAVLVLRFVEGIDDARIAEILACRQTTVRSLAARGLARIREELT